MKFYAHPRKMTTVLFSLMLSSAYLTAQVPVMIIEMKNGTKIEREITNVSRLAIDNNDLSLVFLSSAAETYNPADIEKIYFENVGTPLGLNEESLQSPVINAASNGKSLHITGIICDNTPLYIYALNGSCVASEILNSGYNNVDISDLAQGLYIVKINDFTTKFIKR